MRRWQLTPEQREQLLPHARRPARTAWSWADRSGEVAGIDPAARTTLQRWSEGDKSIRILWPLALGVNFGAPRKVDLTEEQERAVASWLAEQPSAAITCPICDTAHDLRPNAVAWYPLLEMAPPQPSPLVVIASCGTCLGIDGHDAFAWIDAEAAGLEVPEG